jgi:hypothetical protein
MRSMLQRKLSRGSNASERDAEDDEARDQLGGLGGNASQRGPPGRPPLGPGSRCRSSGFGSSNSSHGGSSSSAGTRSVGGSSAGSGGGARSLGDGSEATSVDFNQGAGDDTQLGKFLALLLLLLSPLAVLKLLTTAVL